jgi:hypothetical protein
MQVAAARRARQRSHQQDRRLSIAPESSIAPKLQKSSHIRLAMVASSIFPVYAVTTKGYLARRAGTPKRS